MHRYKQKKTRSKIQFVHVPRNDSITSESVISIAGRIAKLFNVRYGKNSDSRNAESNVSPCRKTFILRSTDEISDQRDIDRKLGKKKKRKKTFICKQSVLSKHYATFERHAETLYAVADSRVTRDEQNVPLCICRYHFSAALQG